MEFTDRGNYIVTVGVGDSFQAPLEVGDDEVLRRLLATLESFEHSLVSSFQYALYVLQHFSRKVIDNSYVETDPVESPGDLPSGPSFSPCTPWPSCCSSPSS